MASFLKTFNLKILFLIFIVLSSYGGTVAQLNLTGECRIWSVPGAGDDPVKYFNSPEEACKDYIVRFRPTETWVKGVYVSNNNQYTCNSDFSPTVSITNAERASRDDCCDEPVLGPYSNFVLDLFKVRGYYSFKPPKFSIVSLPPLRGLEYSDTQRKQILMRNVMENGSLQSDVLVYMIPGVNDYCPNGLDLTDPNAHCAPQVHHIAPRKDSKGCDCGRNSNYNAVVISRKLNNEISNDCNNPKLKAILDFFKLSVIESLGSDAIKANIGPQRKLKPISKKIQNRIDIYIKKTEK